MPARRPDDRRRSQRFPLRLPVHVVKLRNRPVEMSAETKNVSSVGAYFWSDDERLTAGEPIEFRVTLREPASSSESPVRIYCKGRIARIEPGVRSLGDGVAATIDRYRFERPAAAASRKASRLVSDPGRPV